MNDNLAEIVAVADRSGSMGHLKNEAIGGFNSFLEEQQRFTGDANFTLVLFDHEYLLVHDGINIQDVPPLNEYTYHPRGTTALLDAVGKTINVVGTRLSNTPEAERPSKVIFCILTDGQENSSKEFELEQIKSMIAHQQEKYNWHFLFLASGLDAFESGKALGLDQFTTQYAQTAQGTAEAYSYATRSVSHYRSEP